MGVLGEGDHDRETIMGHTKKIVDGIETAMDALVAAYMEKEEEMKAAAFSVLDVNCDGTLQLGEFLACQKTNTETNSKFYDALGFGEQALAEKIAQVVMS